MSDLWQEEVREAGGDKLVKILAEIKDAIKSVEKRLDAIERYQNELSAFAESLHKGFPNRDPDDHRRVHEVMQEKVEETRRLRVAIQEKTISALIWSGIVFIGAAVWSHLLTRVGVTRP